MEAGKTKDVAVQSAENARWYKKEGSFWVPPLSRYDYLLNDAHQNVGDQPNHQALHSGRSTRARAAPCVGGRAGQSVQGRAASGLARARDAGKILGRPRALTAKQEHLVQQRLAQGDAVAAIARDLDTSRQTVMRVRSRMSVERPN